MYICVYIHTHVKLAWSNGTSISPCETSISLCYMCIYNCEYMCIYMCVYIHICTAHMGDFHFVVLYVYVQLRIYVYLHVCIYTYMYSSHGEMEVSAQLATLQQQMIEKINFIETMLRPVNFGIIIEYNT